MTILETPPCVDLSYIGKARFALPCLLEGKFEFHEFPIIFLPAIDPTEEREFSLALRERPPEPIDAGHEI